MELPPPRPPVSGMSLCSMRIAIFSVDNHISVIRFESELTQSSAAACVGPPDPGTSIGPCESAYASHRGGNRLERQVFYI